jgi:hypothetical protein
VAEPMKMAGLAQVPDRVEFQEIVGGADHRPVSLDPRETPVQELAESSRNSIWPKTGSTT